MHRRFGVTGIPYTGADVAAAVSEVAGGDWTPFFATYIDGAAPPLPLPEALERLGIQAAQFADEVYLEPVAEPTPAQLALRRAITRG